MLNQLKLMEEFVRKVIEKRMTETGGDEAVDKDGSGVDSRRGGKTINVMEVEICRPCYAVNMGQER